MTVIDLRQLSKIFAAAADALSDELQGKTITLLQKQQWLDTINAAYSEIRQLITQAAADPAGATLHYHDNVLGKDIKRLLPPDVMFDRNTVFSENPPVMAKFHRLIGIKIGGLRQP